VLLKQFYSFGVADPNALNPQAARFGPPTLVSRVVVFDGLVAYVNFPPGQVVPAPGGSGFVNVIPSQPAKGDFPIIGTITINGQPAFALANNLGLAGSFVAVPNASGVPLTITPSGHLLYEIFSAMRVDVPDPSAGGVVGRTKISDDNNPLPRDRVIFDYDYFGNAQLTVQGVGVHRFSAGFEKTFLDQRASVEVRIPFASTISSDVAADGVNGGGHVELGDVNITLKALLYHGDVLNFSAGLGIATPTADNVRVFLGGTELARINNDSVVLTPYFAYLLTPIDRLFFQNWYQFSFDANGNQVLANTGPLGLLQSAGRYNEQALFQLDAQLGYWLYRSGDPCRLLRGLAPFIELHYNSTMGRADSVQAGALTLGQPSSHFDELNLSAGFAAQIRDNFNLTVGAVAPLKGQPDRTFDWQVGVHGSWFFGPTAHQRSALYCWGTGIPADVPGALRQRSVAGVKA
jgi:hypothetical protein